MSFKNKLFVKIGPLFQELKGKTHNTQTARIFHKPT